MGHTGKRQVYQEEDIRIALKAVEYIFAEKPELLSKYLSLLHCRNCIAFANYELNKIEARLNNWNEILLSGECSVCGNKVRKLIDVWDDDDLYLKTDFVRMNRAMFG